MRSALLTRGFLLRCPVNNPFLTKIAAAKAKKDRDHHDDVLDMLDKSPGVVAQHSMGSGKSLLALRAAARAQKEHPHQSVVISAPASVVKQFPDEAKKFNIDLDQKRLKLMSHEELVNKAESIAKDWPSLLVVDEAHRLRNTGTAKNKAHALVREHSDKALLLSGTAMYNKPHDLASLVNLAAGSKRLPENEKDFEKEFIGVEKIDPGFSKRLFGAQYGERQYLKNRGTLKKILKEHVHNFDAQEHLPEEFAKTEERVHKVEMSPEQYRYYRFAEDQIPWPIRVKIRAGLPLSKKESASLNAFSSGVRQISNSFASYTMDPSKVDPSPKFNTMLQHQKELREKLKKNYRGVVYSNYLGSGLAHYSKLLEKEGIPHGVYTGELSKTEKKRMVDDYNDGKFDTLLLSSSGAEGLNLKGVRHVQVMEPHWNESKIRQVAARAVRRGSHSHLPEKDRHVVIDHYHSELPKGFLGKKKGEAIDEYLHNLSKEKETLKREIDSVIES